MAWYRTGTISLTNGSTTVTGSSTAWIANAAVGEALYAPDGRLYEIASVASNTSLTLATPYLGTTASGQTYVIVPSQSYIRDLAAQAATLVNNYSTIYNTVGQGKFAEGTVSAPSITFATDTDTGFYHSAANEVTFVANGQAIFKYNTSGLSLTSGSLSLAGSNTLGDSDSGDTQTLNGATVINANSSNAGLRITQTGTGNALLVEDSANPDSSPFVIDTSGNVVVGKTTARANYFGGTSTPQIQGSAFVSTDRGGAFSSGPAFILAKNRGSTGDNTIVQSGDSFGQLSFQGADGTNMVAGSSIEAFVDGTPGTNDMPGRLVFSTTADGASSPTERMRIDSAGRVGIGTVANSYGNFFLGKQLTGQVFNSAMYVTSTIASDVTNTASAYTSQLATSANAFTLSNINHFIASPSAKGAGSTITNQHGFRAESTLTDATNNYGFYSNIASGTGRYNFYAAGSADNYFAGNVFINSATGVADSSGATRVLQVKGTTGAASASLFARYSNDVNPSAIYFAKSRSASVGTNTVVASGDELGRIGFDGADGTNLISAATIQAFVDGTPGTNDMPGRLVFSTAADGASTPTERMRIDNAGRVGIGGAPSAGQNFVSYRNITGSAFSNGIYSAGAVQSDVTSRADMFLSGPSTAASITVPNLNHYFADQVYKGSGATVTSQYGFHASSGLTGATNNYGFYSNIASGTGRWNFYAAGTAANYFAGNVGINNTNPIFQLDVSGNVHTTASYVLDNDNALYWGAGDGSSNIKGNSTTDYLAFTTASTERMRIDSSGNLIQSAPTTAPTLSTNGTMVFNLTSNTNLRVSVRGSDGVTRTANITLA